MRTRIIAILMILAGAAALVYPTAARFYYDAEQAALLEEMEQVVEDSDAEETAESTEAIPVTGDSEAAALEAAEAAKQKALEQKKRREQLLKEHTVGILQIEAIGLKMPVLDEATPEKLKISAAKVQGTASPGAVGNFAIAGHRSKTYGRNFNRLDDLAPGMTATFLAGDTTYSYEIVEKRIVPPEAVEVLYNHDFKEMTLITCHPINNPDSRLIITLKQVSP